MLTVGKFKLHVKEKHKSRSRPAVNCISFTWSRSLQSSMSIWASNVWSVCFTSPFVLHPHGDNDPPPSPPCAPCTPCTPCTWPVWRWEKMCISVGVALFVQTRKPVWRLTNSEDAKCMYVRVSKSIRGFSGLTMFNFLSECTNIPVLHPPCSNYSMLFQRLRQIHSCRVFRKAGSDYKSHNCGEGDAISWGYYFESILQTFIIRLSYIIHWCLSKLHFNLRPY